MSQGGANPRPGDKTAYCRSRKHDDNNCDTDERRMVRHERPGGCRREHPCHGIGILKGSGLPERKRFHGPGIGLFAGHLRARELAGNEKQGR